MLPGGKLYVPGAERLLPNIHRLTDAARRGRVFLVSHGCFHSKDDPEFQTFPPHCIEGATGSRICSRGVSGEGNYDTERVLGIGERSDLSQYQQILLEKQTLDIFQSRHAGELVDRFANDAPEFVVFGVVTGCLRSFRGKGIARAWPSLAVVKDAIETLNPEDGQRTVAELKALGASFITTDRALARLEVAK